MSDVQSKPGTPAKPAKAVKKASDTPVIDGACAAILKGASELPESVKLAAPHGFLTEAGDLVAWLQNEVVTDEADIKLLIERGARLFGLGDEPAEPTQAA